MEISYQRSSATPLGYQLFPFLPTIDERNLIKTTAITAQTTGHCTPFNRPIQLYSSRVDLDIHIHNIIICIDN